MLFRSPLGPGSHEVVAAAGTATGLDLDQLVLDSAPGGGPERADRPDALVAVPTSAAPSVRLVRTGATTVEAQVRVTPSTARQPFWLVLGESLNAGWQARLDGGPSLGPPRLVDGFANGWPLPPGAVRPGRWTTVTLTWAPQRAVAGGLVVSAAAALVCLGLLLWPRRRPPARPGARTADGAGALPAFEPAVAPMDGGATGTGPDGRRVAVAAVATGALTAVTFDPLVGAGVGAAVAAACLVRYGRAILAAGALSLGLAAALSVVVGQGVGGYVANGDWPSHFTVAAALTWSALGLLVGEAAVRWARRGRAGPRARPRAHRGSRPPSPPS